MKTLIIVAALVSATAATACSSSTADPAPTTGTGTTGTPATEPTTAPPADTTPAGGTTTTPPAAAAPKAPTIQTVAKMQGALHVMWANPTPACDTVEGERQATMADGTVMEKYKVVFTVPGEADNKHDTSATAAMTYSYRLRCKVGTAFSSYSNEKSGSPK